VYSVEIARLDDLATRFIRSGMKVAAVEGAGLGLGGMLTIVPDLSILAGITLRTIQKLTCSMVLSSIPTRRPQSFGSPAASAAGVDISRELLEKEVINKFVPRVIQRIAVQASEKWWKSGRRG